MLGFCEEFKESEIFLLTSLSFVLQQQVESNAFDDDEVEGKKGEIDFVLLFEISLVVINSKFCLSEFAFPN